MSLLNKTELQKLEQKIVAAEKNTDAELVVVLSRQSDSYFYIPMLWAAISALLIPAALWIAGLWLSVGDIFLLQAGSFAGVALFLRLPFVLTRVIPPSVKLYRAQNLARAQFLENNLHHTTNDSGVLIFISEAERFVEILADRGISQHVSQEQWQGIVDSLINSIKQGNISAGISSCVDSCAGLLAEHVPATHERNELPNHLVVL